MRLPAMAIPKTAKTYQTQFGGVCRLEAVPDTMFADAFGVSMNEFPVLTTRKKWQLGYTFKGNFNGMYDKNGLLMVDGTTLIYRGVDTGIRVSDCKKQMVGMGSGVYIFPDKIRFDTVSGTVSNLDHTILGTGWRVSLCDIDGVPYDNYTVSDEPPDSPANGALWLDTAVEGMSLKQWSESMQLWQPIATTYIRISGTGIGSGFKPMDVVEINGHNEAALNGSFEITAIGEDFIAHVGIISEAFDEAGNVTIKREMPELDYVCEMNNRLWGCSSANHEIYASALGDASNWRQYQGVASDSYAVTVGSDGDFTGCVGYMGSAIFFKSNEIIKIYGTKPSNYQMSSLKGRGVASGCAASIAIVNELLYYVSTDGVMTYDAGGMPGSASLALGNEWYTDAVGAASPDGAYTVSWYRGNGEPETMAYDRQNGYWIGLKRARVEGLTRSGRGLYGVCDGRLVCIAGDAEAISGGTEEPDRRSVIETGDIGMNSPNRKRISKIQIRLQLFENAEAKISIMYDSDREWTEISRITGNSAKTPFTIPIIARRCDHARVKIEWYGDMNLYSIARTVEEGSERR